MRRESDRDKAPTHCDNERLHLRREAAVSRAGGRRDEGTSPAPLQLSSLIVLVFFSYLFIYLFVFLLKPKSHNHNTGLSQIYHTLP